jgi:hypothetical protein
MRRIYHPGVRRKWIWTRSQKKTIKKWIWTRSESHSLKWLRRTWHLVVRRTWVWTGSHYNMCISEKITRGLVVFRVYGLESGHWLHQGHRPERVTTCWLWSSGQDPPVPSGRKRIRKWSWTRSHTHWNEENIPPWCEEEINLDNISKKKIKKWIWTRSESHSLKWLRGQGEYHNRISEKITRDSVVFRVYELDSVHWLHQGHRPEGVTTCWLWSSGQDPPVPSGRKRIR